MKIIPAIDILGGECVQLVEGDPKTKKSYGSPVDVALRWRKAGARMLHVVDLDAALGGGSNMDLIMGLKEAVGIPIHVGGGIRDLKTAEKILESGIDRIILGTLALKDRDSGFKTLRKLNSEFGRDRIIVALDSKDGYVVVKGWTENTGIKATDLFREFSDLAWGFLYTNVSVEGRMRGIDLDEIKKIVKSARVPVIISGGITTAKDIKDIEETGAWGVVLGKALYEGKISPREILR